MTVASDWSFPSDLQRDASRYHQLVRMLRAAKARIGEVEEGSPDIGQILERLLPDLAAALNAEQAFAAILRGESDGTRYFEVTHAHPWYESRAVLIPWGVWSDELVRNGQVFSHVPIDATDSDLVPGFEPLGARSVIVVRMQSVRDIRIVGICNEKDPTFGPFLASDCRVLDSIIQLVAIGVRVGERRSLELEGIQETSTAVSAELDLDKLLRLITERAAEVFHAPATSLMLWDETERNLVIRAAHGLSDVYKKRLRIPKIRVEQRLRPDGSSGPMVINLHRDPLAGRKLAAREGLCQTLSAPLYVSGKLIGVLDIYTKGVSLQSPRIFTPEEMELIRIFANQAAVAVHNARLYQESRQQTRHWQALHEASKAIAEGFGLSHHALLERILEQAVQCITGVDGPKARLAFMQLYNAERNELRFECVFPAAIRAELTTRIGEERVLDRAQVPGGHIGISGRAVVERKSQLVPDVHRDPDYLKFDPITRSELDVPLVDNDEIIGVLSVESEHLDAFDRNDQSALEGLASMAVIVIKNAEQAEELRRTNVLAVMGAWGAEMAHDAKEEVGAIRRAVDILQTRHDLPDEVRAYLSEIDGCAEELALPMLPQEPPPLGQAATLRDPACLEETLHGEMDRLERRYPHIEWRSDFQATGIRVAMHHRWLRHLLRHLTRNAVQAMEGAPGPQVITVRTRVENTLSRVEVEDTGKGVRSDIRLALFQVPVPHEDDRPPGRGLLLVRFLAEQHGGTAACLWSELGRGSRFAFTVPLAGPDGA